MTKESFYTIHKWPLLLLAISSIFLYSNTLNNDFVLDDDVVFLKNQFVQEGVSGIDDILSHGFLYGFNQRNDQSYRPLVLINYAIDKSLFGNNASAHHFLNILYYALLVLLIYRLFVQLLPEETHWLAFWIALIYSFHPIHTEVIANIKGRDELLHAIFAVSALFYSLKFFDLKESKYRWYSLLFFFLALLSKEMAVSLILLIPITIYFFREVDMKRLIQLSLPLFGVFALYMFIRQMVLDDITFADDMSVINNTLAGAPTFANRLATNILIFGNYLKLLVFPHPLSWDYSYPHFQIVGFNYPWVILTAVLLLTGIVLAVLGIRTKNKYAWSLLFFLISFSVVSNFFILIGSTLGERFLFFPSIAFCFFLVVLIQDLDKKYANRRRKYAIPMLTAILLIPMAAKTISRNAEWESNESLFISGVEATPNNSRAVSALASVYRVRGESAQNPREREQNLLKAKEYYLESIKLYNDNADALYNLGVTYNNLGNQEKARLAYEKVVKISPNHMNGLNNLGVIYFQRSDFEQAEQYFKRALELNPNFANAYANLGAVEHNKGNRELARQYYQKALQLNPQDINTRNNLQLLNN